MAHKFNSSQALAKALRVSEPSIMRWRNSGMPCKVDGFKYIYDAKRVQKWLIQKGWKHQALSERLDKYLTD